MAGAFGGDYPDDYEDEEDDDDIDEVVVNYGDEPEDEEEDDDDEEDEDEEGGEDEGNSDREKQEKLKKQQEEAEKKILTPILTQTDTALNARKVPILLPHEKKAVERAEKHKSLKQKVVSIKTKLLKILGELMQKIMSAISSIGPYGLAIIGGIFLIIVIVAVIAGAGIDPGSALFGIKGDKFYGMRMIYKDQTQAQVCLLEDYSSVIEESINQAEKIVGYYAVTTQENGEDVTKYYSLTVDITIDIPTGEDDTEYDYSTFNEETFNAEYQTFGTILNSMAEVVFKNDNPEETLPSTLLDRLNGIKYFGLNAKLINDDSSSGDEVQGVITENFKTNFTVNQTEVQNPTGVQYADFATFQTEVSETLLENSIENMFAENADKYQVRTEKLFVKDFILEDDEMVSGVEVKNYVALIFMPKENVTFTKFSFYVEENDVAGINISKDGQQVEQLKKDDANFKINDDDPDKYHYYVNSTTLSADAFANIDTANVEALAEGLSLIEIVKTLNYETYLKLAEGQTDIYTFKDNGVGVLFEEDNEFRIYENETLYN